MNHPRHSRGLVLDSIQRKPCHKRHIGAAASGKRQYSIQDKAVAVEIQVNFLDSMYKMLYPLCDSHTELGIFEKLLLILIFTLACVIAWVILNILVILFI